MHAADAWCPLTAARRSEVGCFAVIVLGVSQGAHSFAVVFLGLVVVCRLFCIVFSSDPASNQDVELLLFPRSLRLLGWPSPRDLGVSVVLGFDSFSCLSTILINKPAVSLGIGWFSGKKDFWEEWPNLHQV